MTTPEPVHWESETRPWRIDIPADPAKVDLLRQNAQRLYAMVAPDIVQESEPGRE
jgi:hypothetical protein